MAFENLEEITLLSECFLFFLQPATASFPSLSLANNTSLYEITTNLTNSILNVYDYEHNQTYSTTGSHNQEDSGLKTFTVKDNDNGIEYIKNDYDPADGKVKPSWVDIEFADIQKSRWPDFRDAQRAFHFYTMNITTLRQYFPDKDEVWFKNVASKIRISCNMNA